ncbi:hypothetical protein BDV36DRAFT_300444 [Aspergillus pseudocaelatus]|uniref:Nephrocystin 3-like N-terminal domain-containing protein n=1 Tax=Aspergillus pseudocaelatus TaxID=1825620 RepID=A0ABQ6W9U8_9EURO|nr:hypothetical protein BDV36DRAFT_300444 [Aspergillus pseudocaelatus]
MDPFSALSIATAVLQFVDFGTKLLSGAHEIYYSTTGTTEENSLHRLAAKCGTLSKELLQLIRRSIPSDPKSKRAVLRAIFTDRLHEKEEASIVGYIEGISELKQRFQSLAEESFDGFASLQTNLNSFHTVLKSTVSSNASALLQELLNTPSQALAETRILQGMASASMHQRENQIDEAHFETFRWIVDDASKSHGLYRRRFNQWVREGTGVFHISGKLGSGKSTLMKFPSTHKHTINGLEQWAGRKRLTLDGLLCGVLHDTLKQCLEFIPVVFPEQWEESMRSDWRVHLQFRFSQKDIRAALSTLLHNEELYKKHRLCFFIDGLDECLETYQEDYHDMVNLLLGWIDVAPFDLKLCPSSRNYEIFRTAFKDEKRLQLHELTRHDIENFVIHRLKGFEICSYTKSAAQAKQKLVKEIVDRADGVFLWVALVLKSLRGSLKYDNQLEHLLRRIQMIPREMEPLIDHLLTWANPLDRISAYRTFAVVGKLSELGMAPMTLLRDSFSSDYEMDTTFAMHTELRGCG